MPSWLKIRAIGGTEPMREQAYSANFSLGAMSLEYCVILGHYSNYRSSFIEFIIYAIEGKDGSRSHEAVTRQLELLRRVD